ncbi:MAG: hypothetical protein NVS3B25_27330 [Hymenobacter sp.]
MVEGSPTDPGAVPAWSRLTQDHDVTWSGPAGRVGAGSNALAKAPALPGHYRYIGTTSAGGCTFADTVTVRVAPGTMWLPRQNTDLAQAANWTCLPGPATDAEVRGTAAGQPGLSTGLVQVHNLTLRAGTALALNGGTLEVYGALTLEPGATLAGTAGTLSLRGAAVTLTAPSAAALQVPRLLVSLPAATDTAHLAQGLTVGSALVVQRGVLKTHAAPLVLAAGATCSETAEAYVSGQVVASGMLSATGSLNFGGLGLSLTQATGSLGLIRLTRVTDAAIGRAPARTSIRRYYTLTPTAAAGATATVRLGYRAAELNGLPEADLQPFRAGALAGPWLPIARTAQSMGLHFVECTAAIAGTWTLSTAGAMLPARAGTPAGLGVMALPVPFGTTGFALTLHATRPQPAAVVALYDLTGRRLLLRTLSLPAGPNTVALPEAGQLAAGVYVVRVVLGGGETQTLRVTRE